MAVFACSWQEHACRCVCRGKGGMEIWGEHCVQVYGKFTRRGRAHVYSCISTVTYLQLESAVKCKCDVCAITGQCENKG